ncbi:class I histocompatibility antigen, F10 alpha chain-like [Dunckerocampus dactyliophorus]|uniref:class I histocompatibility antigen, F10 alpha chain-like n=1 Tax=Dunckerocampus dactyliophorus TaxID=161453 RepID=UPI00240733AE|nr:class I histocompatibility antigen, F10 alpha chain-like [Dunckerocampus dactyliophorus]
MNLLLSFLLAVQIHRVAPVIHKLNYLTTASSTVKYIPGFVEVRCVDEVEIFYYDSNTRKAEAKQDWLKKYTAFGIEMYYWQGQVRNAADNEKVYQYYIEIAKELFNQTGGVHILQVMYGCEWDDETDEVKGWFQAGYDGEDIISLDMKTWTWTAAKPQAVSIKYLWDGDKAELDYHKDYYTNYCPYCLKNYVNSGRKVLMRTELPEVFLLQKTPSSPVSCFATGFYPNRVALFWRKDGEELHEDVEHGELLPNHDGTFQLTVDLNVEVTADVEGKYECVFQLSGVKEDMVTKLERRSILSNANHEDHGSVAVAATVAVVTVVVVLLAAIIIVKCRKNRQANHDPAARDGGSELSECLSAES